MAGRWKWGERGFIGEVLFELGGGDLTDALDECYPRLSKQRE